MMTMLKLLLRYGALFYAATVLQEEAGKVLSEVIDPLLPWKNQPAPELLEDEPAEPAEAAEAPRPVEPHDRENLEQ